MASIRRRAISTSLPKWLKKWQEFYRGVFDRQESFDVWRDRELVLTRLNWPVVVPGGEKLTFPAILEVAAKRGLVAVDEGLKAESVFSVARADSDSAAYLLWVGDPRDSRSYLRDMSADELRRNQWSTTTIEEEMLFRLFLHYHKIDGGLRDHVVCVDSWVEATPGGTLARWLSKAKPSRWFSETRIDRYPALFLHHPQPFFLTLVTPRSSLPAREALIPPVP